MIFFVVKSTFSAFKRQNLCLVENQQVTWQQTDRLP